HDPGKRRFGRAEEYAAQLRETTATRRRGAVECLPLADAGRLVRSHVDSVESAGFFLVGRLVERDANDTVLALANDAAPPLAALALNGEDDRSAGPQSGPGQTSLNVALAER